MQFLCLIMGDNNGNGLYKPGSINKCTYANFETSHQQALCRPPMRGSMSCVAERYRGRVVSPSSMKRDFIQNTRSFY